MCTTQTVCGLVKCKCVFIASSLTHPLLLVNCCRAETYRKTVNTNMALFREGSPPCSGENLGWTDNELATMASINIGWGTRVQVSELAVKLRWQRKENWWASENVAREETKQGSRGTEKEILRIVRILCVYFHGPRCWQLQVIPTHGKTTHRCISVLGRAHTYFVCSRNLDFTVKQ